MNFPGTPRDRFRHIWRNGHLKAKKKISENITQIDSTKSSADVIAPISLKITEFNAILEEEPELLNKSPTDEG